MPKECGGHAWWRTPRWSDDSTTLTVLSENSIVETVIPIVQTRMGGCGLATPFTSAIPTILIVVAVSALSFPTIALPALSLPAIAIPFPTVIP